MFNLLIENLLKILPTIALKLVVLVLVILIFPKTMNILLKFYLKTLNKKDVDPLFKSFSHSLLNTIGYIIMFFIVLGILGIRGTSVITVLGAAGLAIGLALQGSLTNLAGGMLILLFRPFAKGEYITNNNGAEGTVDQIFILYTHLMTPDNKLVVVPNAELANSTIINYTRAIDRRLDIIVAVSNETSLDKVQAVLRKVADEYPASLPERPKMVEMYKQNIGYMDILFRIWVKNSDYWPSLFELNGIIKRTLDLENIEIPNQKIDIYNKVLQNNKNR